MKYLYTCISNLWLTLSSWWLLSFQFFSSAGKLCWSSKFPVISGVSDQNTKLGNRFEAYYCNYCIMSSHIFAYLFPLFFQQPCLEKKNGWRLCYILTKGGETFLAPSNRLWNSQNCPFFASTMTSSLACGLLSGRGTYLGLHDLEPSRILLYLRRWNIYDQGVGQREWSRTVLSLDSD